MRIDSVAFVSPRFSEQATVGGAETLLRRLAERLARRGSRVTFLATCARNHFTWKNELEPGERAVGSLRVIRFPADENRDLDAFFSIQSRISRGAAVSEAEEQTWLANSVQSRALCAHLTQQGREYDCVIAGPYLFGLVEAASRAASDRFVLVPCLHDEGFARLRFVRAMFGRARTVLFNSGPEQELAGELMGAAAARGPVVGMGMDPFDADPSACPRARALGRPYAIYSGRREEAKGTPLLLEYLDAFRRRTGRDLALVLTGSGPVAPPAALAPHVLDLGFVSEEEKHAAMAGAVAFVHPSVYESLGIVLLESFLAGTPALVHARGRVLRWQCARSGGGLWFVGYPDFEEALCALLDRPGLRAALGAQGRRYVLAEYAWKAVEDRLLAALRAG